MENVSRALLIAAGILFAIILLSLLLSMYNRISGIANTKEEILEQEQLEEFNGQYEFYNKGLLYGVDVISLNNKIIQNNIDHPYQTISLYLNNNKVNSITLTDNIATIRTTSNSYDVTDFNKNLFECEKINYSNSGKVKEIYINDFNKGD